MPKASPKNPVVEQARKACASELAAVEFWERYRWADSPACVHCGGTDVYKMMQRGTAERDERFRWRCRDCGKQYTVRIGTVMESSNIAFRHWTFALWLYTSSKKGFAAKQLERMTGISYKSALFLAHHIRYAMADEPTTPLAGVVEVDESYVGGKPRPLSKQARERYAAEGKEAPRNKRGRGTDKTPVVALVERGGRVVASPLASVNAFNLKTAIRRYCSPEAAIMTDEASLYSGIGRHFEGGHHTTNHGDKEYARREEDGSVTHSNTAESFFSLLERSMMGVHHSVSPRHLHRYVSEMAWRFSNRRVCDGERMLMLLKATEGKKLANRKSAAL